MDIGCYLLSDGKFEKALLSEKMLVELSKILRTEGTEVVHYSDRSIEVEGIYIPAKGTKTGLIALPNVED